MAVDPRQPGAPVIDPGHLLPVQAWAEVVARVERDADPTDPFHVTDGLTDLEQEG